jgi:hypothetical protein
MLGRKSYERAELDTGRQAIEGQLAAYKRLAAAVERSGDDEARSALEAFEPRFLATLVLALDRYYVHRLRVTSGKDGNALNEVELLTESLLRGDGVFHTNNVIRYVPEQAIVKLRPGEPVQLSVDELDQLTEAFFSTLEQKFVTG